MNNWEILQNETVAESLERVSAKVARDWGFDADDLQQEGAVVLAKDEHFTGYVEEEQWGFLEHRLRQRLVDIVKYEAEHRKRAVSLEALSVAESDEDDGGQYMGLPLFAKPSRVPSRGGSKYDRRLVEETLYSFWDESALYGVQSEYMPDPDMPKGSVDPATAGNTLAHLADLSRAWAWAKRGGLTGTESRSIYCYFGGRWQQQEIANRLGCSRSGVSMAIERGVGKLTAFLNGDRYVDGYEGVDDSAEGVSLREQMDKVPL